MTTTLSRLTLTRLVDGVELSQIFLSIGSTLERTSYYSYQSPSQYKRWLRGYLNEHKLKMLDANKTYVNEQSEYDYLAYSKCVATLEMSKSTNNWQGWALFRLDNRKYCTEQLIIGSLEQLLTELVANHSSSSNVVIIDGRNRNQAPRFEYELSETVAITLRHTR